MTARLDPIANAPQLASAWLAFSNISADSELDDQLCELVRIRASQINRCANCLNMHTATASELGESDQRLHLVAAWREAPCFSERERAALAWTEHLTQLPTHDMPDSLYAELQAHFSQGEQVELTMVIVAINGWNRIAGAFHLFDPALGW